MAASRLSCLSTCKNCGQTQLPGLPLNYLKNKDIDFIDFNLHFFWALDGYFCLTLQYKIYQKSQK